MHEDLRPCALTDCFHARGPVEPLADSAPLAWAMGPQLCPGDPASADACVWYHRAWQCLRLLDVITSIRTNTVFLTSTLDRLASEHPRVLVCGAPNYAMLAHVKHAYGNRRLDVTVRDRCPTSLYLNRWYSERFGFPIATVCGAVLDYTSDEPYDLICTHNFIGRFDATSRQRVAARWHALLRRGGVVVTTQRVRPHDREGKYFYTSDEARALSARVMKAAAERPGLFAGDPDELAQVVYEHAMRRGGYAIRATREITDLFAGEGFDVELVDDGGGASERERDRPRSTAGTDTYRMRVVARRR